MGRWFDVVIVASLLAIAVAILGANWLVAGRVSELSKRTVMVQCDCR